MKHGRFGHYRILSKIGEGGMGTVWKARDAVLGLTVALKLLPESLAFSPPSRRRFVREARAIAALDHPGVARVFEAGELEGRLYIAMEWVEGTTLSARIATGPLPIRRALRIAIAVSEALAHAHARGVIHRDVTGRNIMLGRGGRVVVLDFGLALAVGASRFTTTAATVGTLHYIAPEVALGGEGDARSDLYALGVVLYEMLIGQPPFVAERPEAALYAAVNQPPQPPSLKRPRVPGELDGIVLRALAKEPELRHQSAEELLAELRALCAGMERPRTGLGRERPGGRGRASPGPTLERSAPGVRDQGGRTRTAAESRARIPKHVRLAVLPFADPGSARGRAAERQTVAGGLAEAVSLRLARHPGLQVIPFSAAGANGDTPVDACWHAASLGANVALCGTVERRARRTSVRFSLLDVRLGTTLGKGACEGRVGDFAAIEGLLVERVAGLLDLPDHDPAAAQSAGDETRDGAAYEHFLQALGYLQRYENGASVDGAIALLEGLRSSALPAARVHAALGRACLYKYKLTSRPDWEKRAVAECARAIQLDPKLPEALVTLGYVHGATGRHEQAARELERALELEPRHPDALLGLAAAYETAGKLGQAEQACERAIALRPDYWGGHSRLGYLHFLQGHYADAIERWKRVVRLTPDNARGYYNLGAAYFRIGRYAAAREAYERSLEIQPTATAYSGLGTVSFFQRRYEQAAAMLERATALRPDDALKWANLGDAYRWIRGRESEAGAAYDRAIALARGHLRLAPTDTRIWCALASALAKRGHHREAVRAIERALAVAPDDVGCMEKAGIVYCVVGDHERALECLRRAVRSGLSARSLEHEPELTPIRGRREFQQILKDGSPTGARSAPRRSSTKGARHAGTESH